MTDSPEERPDESEEATTGTTPGPGASEEVDWQLAAQAHHDRDDPDGLTITIIEAVAEAEGVHPTAILDPPLYDSVDTAEFEAALFDTFRGGSVGPDAGSFEFVYRGYRIVVRGDGWVLVHEREGG